MSLKKLFSLHKPVKSIEAATFEDIAEDAESSAYVKSFFIDREKHLPEVDYSDPKNFAKFGKILKIHNFHKRLIFGLLPQLIFLTSIDLREAIDQFQNYQF